METFLEFSTNKYKITGYIGKDKYVIEVKSPGKGYNPSGDKTMAKMIKNVKT